MNNLAISKQTSSLRTAWYMLGWLLVAQIIVALVGRSLAPIGPLIEEDLFLTKVQIGLFPAALYFGQLCMSLPAGHFVDKIGSRVWLLGLSITLGLAYILFSISNAYWFILICIFIGGLGYGAMHPTTNRGIMYWFPLHRRGTAMGIKQMGITVGSALSALVLLPLAITIGWRWTLCSVSVLLILVGVLTFFYYKDPPDHLVGRQGLSISSFRESLRHLINNKFILVVSIAAAGLNGLQMSWNTYIVFYAYEKLHLSLIISGSLLVISEISGSLGRVLWGMASDFIFRGNRTIVMIIIAAITLVTSVIFALLPSNTSLIVVIIIVIVFGFCVSGFNGVWMNSASEAVAKNQSGLATGLSITIGSLGVVIIPPMFGWIIDLTLVYLFAWLFLSSIAMIVVGLLFWARRMEKERA